MKFNWKDFMDGKITVYCKNPALREEFLKLCEKHNVLWRSGNKATEARVGSHSKYFMHPRNVFEAPPGMYCAWEPDDRPICEFPFSYPEIHITTDGKTTTAVKVQDGKVVDRAYATLSPDDKFDFEVGAKLAFNRLCHEPKKEKPFLRWTFGEGDRFLGYIGEPTGVYYAFGEEVKVGDVVEVFNVDKNRCEPDFAFVCRDNDGNPYAMGLKGCKIVYGNIAGSSSSFQIRKMTDAYELVPGERHGSVEAVGVKLPEGVSDLLF